MIQFGWGDTRLTVLSAGTLWLDGGAMFGVVPKPLWSRMRAPDERNRICLAMNLLLIEDGKQRMLVDTGAGTDWDDKTREIFKIESKAADEILAPVGLSPEQIDRVIVTHLHFDHAGGNTRIDGQGHTVPSFPNARYVVQAREVETARQDNERIRASYDPTHFEVLFDEDGRVELVDGEHRMTPDVILEPAPGHTPGMQIVRVETGEGTVAFLADLLPTASHLGYGYIMAYDLEPMTTLATKQRILPRAVREDWRVVLEHDTELPLVRLSAIGKRLSAAPVEAHEMEH